MRKNFLMACAAAAISVFGIALSSCSKSSNDAPITPTDNLDQILFSNRTQIGNGDAEFEIKGNYTLPKGTYTMKGWCYITDGSTLTIPAGTIIKGDKATKASLIVERGGKIIAQGTATEPIVFTSAQPAGSRKPGDWGGVIICGKAKNNQTEMIIEGGPRSKHGGNDDADNSGVFSYCRIEFAGYPFATDQEINGLTMGSVGSGTKIDHVQVSYSNDDSFEWFGGSVNCKYLIAYHGWDDEFDTDNGFSGKVQFCLGIRDPKIADQSASNGFESDNNANGTTATPFTSCVFSNMTIIGPAVQDASFANTSTFIDGNGMNPNNGSRLGQFQAAIQIRRNSHLSCFNSIFAGYPVGILIENDKGSATQSAATAGTFKINNVILAACTILGSDKNKSFLDQYSDNGSTLDATKESFSSTFFKSMTSDKYYSDFSLLKLSSSAQYAPQTGSPLLNAAVFTDALLNGMDKVTYIGAFSGPTDTWMNGWTNFDPQHTNY
ncbi:MAG: hypothetical protein LKM37_07865 [Bacteroidales bacterium]|jgi:hypothetical protein|nr:hypothetical protein [Bacteroidales bacterium]